MTSLACPAPRQSFRPVTASYGLAIQTMSFRPSQPRPSNSSCPLKALAASYSITTVNSRLVSRPGMAGPRRINILRRPDALLTAGCSLIPTTSRRDSGGQPRRRWSMCPSPPGIVPRRVRLIQRWRLELVSMFFLFNGKPSWQEVWVIVSEHYAGPSIGESQTMERDFFAYGYGWIRWEGWTTNTLATRDPDLLGRCPGVYIKNGPWPLAEPAAGWVQTACRSWTNIIWDGDGKTTVGGISWAP